MAVTFAAMYPERTLGLILWGTCGLHGAGGSIR
jgi:hypothetical protein